MSLTRIGTALILMSLLPLTAAGLPAQEVLTVGDATARPGETVSGYIQVEAGADAPATVIPVTLINGARPGPVLALTAAVHGYEYPPVLALYRLKNMIDPAQLSGALIIVHVANMPSFLRRTVYYNPYDWKNLNRVFPGRPDGSCSERIAWKLTTEVIDRCDALIDNHCGDGNEDLIHYLYCSVTGDAELDAKIRGMAESYGFKIIVEDVTRPGDPGQAVYCSNTAITRGKPAITIESGKLGRTDEEDVQRVLTGTKNVMKHLGMIPGEPEKVFEPVWIEKYTIITAEADGVFYPVVGRGHHVQKGELVGYLTDFLGKRIQDCRAPYDGIVLYVIATPPLAKGEPMASIGLYK
ncbi:succinylglutamate desuccinylase/aspartoacylase family protein [bacterium]|nr:succinylglutamate desuccinylase/aspartoacylase family protein [bacterium]